MFFLNTQELEKHIYELHEKLRSATEVIGIFKPLDIYFAEIPPQNFEGVFCYADEKGYHYGGTERGEIQLNNLTCSLFEVSYWVMSGVTSAMASDFEAKHRVQGQDIRRIWFEKQIELLGIIGDNYRKRGEIDIDEILKIAPYQDELFKT